MKANTGPTTKLTKYIQACISIISVLAIASCSLLPNQNTNIMPQAQAQEMTIPVTRGTIASSMSFVGNVQYNQSAAQTWKTNGVVEAIYVKVGDQVKQGDILAVLATDSLASSVILAEKNMIEQQEKLEDVLESESARMEAYVALNSKESALKQAKLNQEALYYPRATKEEMERAWDSLALASLNFNYAKQDYDNTVASNEPWTGKSERVTATFMGRTMLLSGENDKSGRELKFDEYVSTYNTLVSAYENYLWTAGEPSASDYAVAEGNVQVAQMEYDKALETYLSYEQMPREKDVFAAEISLNNAENSYNLRFIKAPFDGTVTSVSSVEDYYVTRGSTALRVDDMSRIFIPISISELDISSVSNGTPVTITLDAVSNRTYNGIIYTIADASSSSGTSTSFSAMVEVTNPDENMLAGMTAEISVPINEKTDALLIPNTALTYRDGNPTVTVVDGNNRRAVEVQLGIVSENVSEVVSGNLKEGTELAVSNISRDALMQLGLNPSDYLSEGFGRNNQMPASMPSFDRAPQGSSTVPQSNVEGAHSEDPQVPIQATDQNTIFRRDPSMPEEDAKPENQRPDNPAVTEPISEAPAQKETKEPAKEAEQPTVSATDSATIFRKEPEQPTASAAEPEIKETESVEPTDSFPQFPGDFQPPEGFDGQFPGRNGGQNGRPQFDDNGSRSPRNNAPVPEYSGSSEKG